MPGWMLNSSNLCMKSSNCPAGCTACTSFGCLTCVEGMMLNQAFQCQFLCLPPCSTCNPLNPTMCLTCFYGSTLVNGQCVANNCSSQGTCLTCPVGSAPPFANNTNARINQTCTACNSTLNCARCPQNQPNQCTVCSVGYYLNSSNICQICPNSCLGCLGPNICLICAPGYIPAQSGQIIGMNDNLFPQTCVACQSPCLTCYGDIYSCASCINSNYTLYGDICLSNFYYLVSVVFNVDLAVFENNYLNFMNQIASAAGVSINDITVLSIVSGSVTVTMAISSPNAPGSQAAITAQNNIQNLIQNGTTIDNMPITSSSLTTQGGSNDNNNGGGGGLSTTAIILMAVLIPLGVISTYHSI